jgi:cycloartenol synthase
MQGVKAALTLANTDPAKVGAPLSEERFTAAVNVILSLQNRNGGWPTYELMRSYEAIELINPAETFGGIMVDYSYVECSSACMTALTAFQQRYQTHRAPEIAAALRQGRKFVESIQRKDGSWYGSWAVCFTYGTWFGTCALRAVGLTVAASAHQRRAVEFLLGKQRADGGWGESYVSSQNKEYSQLGGALLYAACNAMTVLSASRVC